jgi:hypothetical protein
MALLLANRFDLQVALHLIAGARRMLLCALM